MNAKELSEYGDRLFGKRTQLMLLWQEIAENFYPERADFTFRRQVGDEFAGELSTSYPILARRDLGNSLGSMLRPASQEWFHMGIEGEADTEAQRWLEWATRTQRRAMYDRASLFVRATKEGDHDYSSFGQCAISVELNRNADGLLYRCWHLRDMAWMENQDGKLGGVWRKWKPTARDLMALFGSRVHANVRTKMEASKDPYCEFECRHIVVESDMYDNKFRTPFVSVYYDVTNNHPMEEVGVWDLGYVIPRWQTVSGSQYAYSPATVAALPDARLIQSMTYTLLEAGEKAVNPPMVAQSDVIRSDISIFAGGITYIDRDYDERMGKPIELLVNDKSGIPLGVDMQRDTRAMIAEAFYLNKLRPFLPTDDKQMTAYEAGQIVAQYIRDAMPLFEPIEDDYNGALCEMTFNRLLRAGGFGPVDMIPETLRGKDIQFRFESPLHDAIERQKGNKFLESKALIAEAVALDASSAAIMKAPEALRDALSGIRTPAKWLRSEREVEEIAAQQAAQQEAEKLLATMQQGADVAATMAQAKPVIA